VAHIAKFQKWGNGRAVIIPKAIWKELRWHVSDMLQISSQAGVVVIQPISLPQTPTVTAVEAREGLAE
jgi:antitoxin component of MazEF toxin-antitoxin module